MLQRLIIVLIRIYRYMISPLLGGCCRFEPTCSTYSLDAVKMFGVWRGCWLSLKRLARCHPWCAGGHDPIPSE